jgi:hypothetical protein
MKKYKDEQRISHDQHNKIVYAGYKAVLAKRQMQEG